MGGLRVTPTDEYHYPVKGAKLVVLINYMDFSVESLETRTGSEQDIAMLEKLFKYELAFDVKTHKNLDIELSRAAIADIAEGSQDIACIVLVLSSHGRTGGAVKTQDGEDLFVGRDVIDELSECQALKNVPKIVIGK